MSELIRHAISFHTIPLTVLLAVVVLYWILVCFGALGIDSLDADTDGDGVPDVIQGHDAEGGGHGHDSLGAVLKFVGAGDVPLTIIASVLTLCMWMLAILLNHWFNGTESFWIGLLLLIPNFFVSLVVARIAVLPFRGMLKALLNSADSGEKASGREGIARTEISDRHGQVEVAALRGEPLLVQGRVSPGSAPIPKGESVIVVSYREADGTWLVRSLQPEIPLSLNPSVVPHDP